MKPFMVRQGDVLIMSTDKIANLGEVVPRDKGRIVLAYGEVTGHAHAILNDEAELFVDSEGQQFLQVIGGLVRINPSVVESSPGMPPTVRVRDALSNLWYRFPAVEGARLRAAIGKSIVYDGVTLQHEEHDAIVVPPGVHTRGTPQREYSPEAIRFVED